MKLPTVRKMQNLDKTAIENFGIPGIVLMENAGLGTVRMIEDQLGPCKDTFALIFVGPGNNGGDGLVIGRHLHQRGCHPVFFFLVNPDSLKGDAATNLNVVKKLRLPFHVIDTQARVETIPILFRQFESRGLPCYCIIDSIFGIGLCREVTGHFADTINLINKPGFAQNAPVISADTPSGMDADTGKVLGCCIRADYTATYGCAKPGHFIHGSSPLTGQLQIIDIGIPPEAVAQSDITIELATEQYFDGIADKLRREKASHKGSHGHLLIVAGSPGKTGAAILCAQGSLRSGAGLVSLCVPGSLNPVFEATLTEAMTIPLNGQYDHFRSEDYEEIFAQLSTRQALVIGPGLSTNPDVTELVLKLYHKASCPVVLDADALNILAANIDRLEAPAGERIFTPHPGELSRLIGKPASEIQDNRLEAAIHGCALFANPVHETILVLKGAGTIIANGQGSTVINTTGNSGMATGGMGDVLSGIIGALLCQGLSSLEAATGGVYLHGLAADLLHQQTPFGFTASEVASMVPRALQHHYTRRSVAKDSGCKAIGQTAALQLTPQCRSHHHLTGSAPCCSK